MSESGEINDVKNKAALGGLKVSFSSDTSNDDDSGEDSRHSSDDGSHSGDDGSRSSHKDSGSTVLVDILSGRTILSRGYRGSAQQQGRR